MRAQLTCGSYDLFEELAEQTRGWTLDFLQLSATRGQCSVSQLACEAMLFSEARFGATFEQRGGPQQGMRGFALTAPGCSTLEWCANPVTSSSLIVFPADGEFSSVSKPGFHILSVALSTRLLEGVAEQVFQLPLRSILRDGRAVVQCRPDAISAVRTTLLQLGQDCNFPAATPRNIELPGQLAHEIARQVLRCLSGPKPSDDRRPPGVRAKALDACLDFLAGNDYSCTSVADLVVHSGVSQRTLEYAFLDRFQTTPQAYLKALRLREVHRELLRGDRSDSVAQIAARTGFRSNGQLANDYRRLYGEKPLATLRR